MKLVTYLENGTEKVGALTADGSAIVPLPVPDMNTLIETMTLAQLSSAVTAAEDSWERVMVSMRVFMSGMGSGKMAAPSFVRAPTFSTPFSR